MTKEVESWHFAKFFRIIYYAYKLLNTDYIEMTN